MLAWAHPAFAQRPRSKGSVARKILVHSYRLARRLTVLVVGGTVLGLGLALVILPGPAFVVIPLGLAILALEFGWARRWLRHVRERSEALLGTSGSEAREDGSL
jgi:tellurite resistance protein TerC